LAQQAGDRVTDVAEILAEHTSEALELAQAAGDAPLVEEAAPAARRYTLLAAEKALPLDAGRAMSLLNAALSLTPPEDDDYPSVLVTWGRAANQVGRLREAADAFQRAADSYRQRRDLMSAGSALAQAAYSLVNLADRNGRDVLDKALFLLESQQPSVELGLGLLALASIESDAGNNDAALGIIQRVEPMVLGDNPELLARFHMTRGAERSRLGDPAGLAEVEQGIALCMSAGLAHLAATWYYNLAGDSLAVAGPEVALRHLDAGEEFCRSRGLMTAASWLSEARLSCLLETGRLSEALTLADAILPAFKEAGDDFSFVGAAAAKALALIETAGSAQDIAAEALQAAQRTAMPGMVVTAQAAAAAAAWAAADWTTAENLLRRIRDTAQPGKPPTFREDVHRIARCAVGIGRVELARDLLRLVQAGPTPVPVQQHALLTARAVVAQAEGDYSTAVQLFTDAARKWERAGRRLERAHALLGLAESRLAAGQDAYQPLRLARDLFTTMGADYRVRHCNERLGDVADAQSAS
jgi:tetratricopeptide (TPR) repeat protein